MYLKILLILLFSIIIIGCPWKITVPPETTGEEWITIVDIDGSNLEYICKSGGETPYFVPDLENQGEELILLDCSNRIDLMNLDGTGRRTIIESVGSVYSFSQDKTMMLLNDNGEIFLANVDGSGFQNLTNTSDINELYPSFSSDSGRIVFSYTLNHSHAYLVVKDLVTNEDEVIYDYTIDRYDKSVNFKYPAFQNDDQILFEFYLFDLTTEPSLIINELHRTNPDTDSTDVIINNDVKVYYFVYNENVNKCIIRTADILMLFDMDTHQIVYETPIDSIHDIYRFSPNANYLSLGSLIYRLIDEMEYYIDSENNDFNLDETKIVGVKYRSYPED